MICNATSVKKYFNESIKLFFIYGSEIVLINDSADQINKFFIKKDLSERIILTKENFKEEKGSGEEEGWHSSGDEENTKGKSSESGDASGGGEDEILYIIYYILYI